MSRINVANFRHPDGTSDNISLTDTGRVGIGTASPSYLLDIRGSSPDIQLNDTDTSGQAYRIQSTNGALRIVNTGVSERLRILSGGGLTFNGDTAAANALDDYEEGTWTPSANGGSSYGNTTGYYCKVGNQVFVSWNAGGFTSSGASGGAYITGLPFAPASNRQGCVSFGRNTFSSGSVPTGFIQTNSVIYSTTLSTGNSPSTNSGSVDVIVSGVYTVG